MLERDLTDGWFTKDRLPLPPDLDRLLQATKTTADDLVVTTVLSYQLSQAKVLYSERNTLYNFLLNAHDLDTKLHIIRNTPHFKLIEGHVFVGPSC